MEPIKPFDFNGTQIRMFDNGGTLWFVAVDVAKALGYRSAEDGKAIRQHCKNAVRHPVDSPIGLRHMNLIPETDLYLLIMRSKLESVELLQRWIIDRLVESEGIKYLKAANIKRMREPSMPPGSVPIPRHRSYDFDDILFCIPDDGIRVGQLQYLVTESYEMSKAQFYRMWKELKDAKLVVPTEKGWIAKP